MYLSWSPQCSANWKGVIWLQFRRFWEGTFCKGKVHSISLNSGLGSHMPQVPRCNHRGTNMLGCRFWELLGISHGLCNAWPNSETQPTLPSYLGHNENICKWASTCWGTQNQASCPRENEGWEMWQVELWEDGFTQILFTQYSGMLFDNIFL